MAKDNGNFEIIFYVLAVVIGLAVNAYRNYTKRKQRQMQPGKEELDFPEVIFGEEEDISEEEPEVLFEEVKSMPEPETVTVEEAPIEVKKEPLHTEGAAMFDLTAEKMISDDIDPTINVEQEDYISSMERAAYAKEGEDENESDVDFDLETAVIFSEILKPKHFDNNY